MTQNIDNKIMRKTMTAGMLRLCMLIIVLATGSATVKAEGEGVRIGGNVYGGGNLADVKVNTEVKMSTGTVEGSVFGGGKGKADNFECDKAMVGVKDDGVRLVSGEGENAVYTLEPGGTTVTITNGTVEGDVFGGGEVGRVERNTIVTIGEAGNTSLKPIIKGNVFGAGKGVETHGYSALVRGNVTVTIQGKAEVWQTVHGGGEKASVGRYQVAISQELADQYHVAMGMPCYLKAGGKCTVNIQDEAVIGQDDIDDSGDVFGAGQGVTPIYNNEVGDVNRSKRMVTKTEDHDENNQNTRDSWDYFEDDKTYVWEYFATEADYLQYVETLGRASATDVVIGGKRGEPEVGQTVGTITASSDAPTVKGTVYGGSESGFVYYSTEVNIEKGTVNQDVFGGGKGLASFAEAGRVRINTNLTISDGTVEGNVYGGGSLGDVGIIDKTNKDDKGQLTYNYFWKQTDGATANTAGYNLPSDNGHDTSKNTGICNVTISGGTIGTNGSADADHGNVFGAGRGTGITWWCEKAIAYATVVSVSGSTVVHGNVYGGGQVGRVEDDGKVTIGNSSDTGEGSKPDIKGDVFGAGAGLYTHGYSALLRGNSDVTVQGIAKVGGNVYGGGEIASVGRFTVPNGLPKEPLSGGDCTVTIKDNATIGTSSTGGNVYGACKGVDPATVSERKSMQLLKNAPQDATLWSHYDDDENSPFIWRYYSEAEYPAFLRTLALTSNPNVTIGATRTWDASTETESFTPSANPSAGTSSETPTVYGSVYGGGQRGITLGKVDVNIVRGIVNKDVYGGGALADTNVGNWDADGYTEVTGLTENVSSVTGLYTLSGTTYTLITDEDAKATSGTTYYSKGKWADAIKMTKKYKTTVDLLGGYIKGDAYGGGLGQKTGFDNATSNIKATVWGDIDVTLDGTKFDITYEDTTDPETDSEGNILKDDDDKTIYVKVVKSGRVFGCNNLFGSPQGDVTVTVYRTVEGNTPRTEYEEEIVGEEVHVIDKRKSDDDKDHTYELAAVYGGGNLAPYETTGKKAHIIINGCGNTSILTVYGGGNAAPVPETAVDVFGCFEIGSVFGGGNGKDKYKKGDKWVINPGADVNGPTNTIIYGGTVHEAYGASNEKGTIYGDVVIDVSNDLPSGVTSCPLDVAKLVGAGKNADVNGDLIIVMGCKPDVQIPYVYGGADNANVNGDVELTITSGWFGKVFGGNNENGCIMGHIKLNIEETGTCDTPIKIEELYLGGNMAAYSQYGYYKYSSNPVTGKPILKPRTAAMAAITDPNAAGYTPAITTADYGSEIRKTAPYEAPELNIISCTYIREVFGGGLGEKAIMYGNPTVNINMEPGALAHKIDRNGDGTADNDATLLGEIGGKYTNDEGQQVYGGVYGGGNAAAVYGTTTVNIGTETKVQMTSVKDENGVLLPTQPEHTVTGAYIVGNVYGGGKLADVGHCTEVDDEQVEDRKNNKVDQAGNTNVNIGVKYNTNTGKWESVPEGTAGVIIAGNVYGGGKGSDESFYCDKAMVLGNLGLSQGGGTNVRIGNGTVKYTADANGNTLTGNVYGGGEIARVENNTAVTIGFGAGDPTTPTSTPVIEGSVFGAGAGLRTHGYSALVRGHSSVTIEGNAKVMQSVYGGGEMATVGRYQVTNNIAEYNISGGECTVTIGGYAEIGPNDMVMNNTTTHKPDDYGHVFGAGKGMQPYEGFEDTEQPWSKIPNGEVKYTKFSDLSDDDKLPKAYATYIRTLALATETDVTIKDHAFVKGCVFGGSENGFVQEDTHVTIQDDCQIGNGYVQMTDDGTYLDKLSTPLTPLAVNRRYTADEWSAGHLIMGANDRQALKDLVSPNNTPTYYTSSLPECASWPYGQAANAADKYAPYDPNYGATGYDSKGGRTTADDGHTFYGSVFGGGSGYYPYKPGRWFEDAGAVYGNTRVDITGGHILTSVYGGNEMTNVGKYVFDSDGKPTTTLESEGGGGKCTVNFGGTATLGVPRTLKQIGAHPVTCYLFGAGKGDQRVFFNKSTNVGDVEVNITGGTIYGSVFGGGEDGHVMRDVKVTIGQQTTTGEGAQATTTVTGPTIGTWGTSYVDGNVFGGGRGFSGDAYTAGNVAGSVKMEIKGGSILGSIYGGGRLGSVGYGLYDELTDGNPTPGYGEMRDDDKMDDGTDGTSFFTKGRGHIDITISGGTIGNNREYIIPNATNMAAAGIPEEDRDISKWDDDNKYWDTWKEYHKIPKTEFDTTTGHLTHTKGGNVFAGGMGNFYKQDGVTYINGVDWWKLGNAKSTKLTITGGTIKSNVYGGGELGQVVGHHTTKNATNEDINVGTEIIIQNTNNTIIGTEVKESVTTTTTNENNEEVTSTSQVTKYTFGSVFGGGYGSLLDEITVNNGTSDVTSNPKFIAGLVKEDTKIDMRGGEVKASIYGGGEMASVGESTTSEGTTTTTGSTYVSVSGGTVGIAPIDVSGVKRYFGGAKMGNVYGGGSGHNNTVRSGRILKSTNVTISGSDTHIYHNIYGGGAYGTVGDFDYQTGSDYEGGPIKVKGINGLATTGTGVARVSVTGGTIGYDGKENGMVFGSSRGDINRPGARDDHTAWVYDTHVTIGSSGSDSGPQINGTVYGSGENGHVFNDTEVSVHSGTIGIYNSTDAGYTVVSNGTSYSGAAYPYRGNVYGGGCGTDKYYSNHALETHDGEGQLYNSLAGIVYGNSTVNITGGRVVRNVYGAGAMGSVGKITTTEGVTTIPSGGLTTINISGGTVGVDGNDNGNVFGAARGDATTNQTDCALVKNTGVTISGSADIKGSVYGGGETGDVHDDTSVTMSGGTVGHNVFGGGKGSSHNFTCDKAMVGVVEQGVTTTGSGDNITYTLLDGGTTVEITAGTVNGNVYGGGEIARVERNTAVTIGADGGTGTPIVKGSVFGAGAGLDTHGYSALVRGHSSVTVQGSAQVWKNVYGGGELASVGRYKVKISEGNPTDAPADLPSGMPYGLKAGGTSTVIIQGSATIGTVNDALTGHVYGAGQGVEPRNYDYLTKEQFDAISENAGKTYNIDEHQPKRMIGNNTWEHFGSRSAYLQFIETLAISAATDVTIGGGTVKGSVFGGSESGFVYRSTDVKIQGGTVEGDAFGGGRGLESFAEAGRVRWNTKLAVSGGAVEGNVYGGGNMGDVGTIYKPAGSYDYVWKNTDSHGNNLVAGNDNALGNNTVAAATNKNTGICTVDISGGTIGLASTNEPTRHGNVFGAGEGSWHTWWCEKAIVYATDVSVKGGTVYGNVYGGGEVGRVEDDAKVTIGTTGETVADKPNITGSVFGGGAGLQTHGYSALVRGDSKVTVQGKAKVVGNVYGGGEIASVGRFKVVDGLPTKPKGGGTCTVVVKDNAAVTGDVYGSCKGVTPAYVATGDNRSKSMQLEANKGTGTQGTDWDYYDSEHKFVWVYYTTKDAYLAFIPTLGLASNTHVTIDGSSAVNGSVFGGGQRGITLGGVDVNINGGTVSQDVYGGGALANSNSSHWHEGQRTEYVELDELLDGSPVTGYYTATSADALITDVNAKANSSATYYAIFKTNVNLKGGTVNRNVYGGGLGQLAKDEDPAIEAKVYGDVSVVLNKPTSTTTGEGESATTTTTYGDCEVKGTIFGCNNLNGSPQAGVDVHVYKTVRKVSGEVADKAKGTYEVAAVYGGGNLAAYYPDDATVRENATAYVTIDGCELTSIGSVYGGGNAASVPATEVVINGTYEIGEAFGGGNGKDDVSYNGTDYVTNPGANVGLRAYPDANNLPYDTKQNRDTNYGYGPGKSHITIYGGTVHSVYGGSNLRGNVRVESRTTLEDAEQCTFNVGEAYGGGNNAPQDGDAVLEIGCISGLDKAYGGASDADVNGNVVLNITNGTYDQVFGGNDAGGAIRGSITVNIEETGCKPIIIGELYGGGCNAAYSVYGYGANNKPLKAGEDGANPTPVRDPVVNVKSFTSIGNIYGGGYGVTATMVGSPEVNINVVKGKYSHQTSEQMFTNRGFVLEDDPNITGKKRYSKEIDKNGTPHTVYVPAHDKDAIGAIYNVFGGGNAADVIGTPHVYIGTLTGEVISLVTKPIADSEGTDPTDEGWTSYELAKAEGIDIRGDVFGGGNAADVTGDTEVVIGKNNSVKTYSFTSYNAASDGTAWSSGLAQTTGATETINNEKYAEVVILTNGKYGEYVGKKFYVNPEGTGRLQLYDANKAATSLWVDIKTFELKTYSFTSYGAENGGSPYSTGGTATATGNFKTFSGQEYMQIVVLTNPGHDEWVGRTFYVTTAEQTGDNLRRRLYKATGEPVDVWVTITKTE
ncbi:MAG: hypothetical protein IKQ59_04825 [Prevotella sp.]|nr:hypothetical protein [Prevotella sp.]